MALNNINSTIKSTQDADIFECLIFEKDVILKEYGKLIFAPFVFTVWASEIRFDDHKQMLIISDKVAEATFDVFWKLYFFKNKFLHK